MIEKLFKYPSEEYHDFSNGIPVSDYEVNKWIKDSFNYIKEEIKQFPERDKFFSHMNSGNTKVIVEAYRQSNEDKFTVFVSVCTSYSKHVELDIEF